MPNYLSDNDRRSAAIQPLAGIFTLIIVAVMLGWLWIFHARPPVESPATFTTTDEPFVVDDSVLSVDLRGSFSLVYTLTWTDTVTVTDGMGVVRTMTGPLTLELPSLRLDQLEPTGVHP